MDTRASLYKNIILSGATTMLPGFSSRLENDMKDLWCAKNGRSLKDAAKFIEIVDTPRRKYSVFSGASFLAQFYANQPDYWITKAEWEEFGSKIIFDKCK